MNPLDTPYNPADACIDDFRDFHERVMAVRSLNDFIFIDNWLKNKHWIVDEYQATYNNYFVTYRLPRGEDDKELVEALMENYDKNNSNDK